MYTETELRDALQHSADRADTVPERLTSTSGRRSRRQAFLPPLIAAAVVAIVAAGVVVRARPTDHNLTVAPAGGGNSTASAPTSPTVAQTTGPTSGPTTAHTTAPATATTSHHVPVALGNTIDLMQARGDTQLYYTIGGNGLVEHGTENIEKGLDRQTLDVTIVDSTELDPARIPRDHPVPIAGTTGYYSKFQLFPLDANTGPGSDKWTPMWTIAFQSPGGKWVFVNIENGVNYDGVNDPAVIAAQYAKLNIDFVADQTRLPFRTGYVPDGYSFDSIYRGFGESWTTLRSGDRTIEIDVLHNRGAGDCAGDCGATRRIGDYTINVVATGSTDDQGLERKVLDSLTVASDLGDESTYWTIADALG